MEPEAPPSFKQNPDQKPSNTKDPEPTFVSNKARSMYKNMFVKGDSEFTGKSDTEKSMTKKEKDVEWPDGLYSLLYLITLNFSNNISSILNCC